METQNLVLTAPEAGRLLGLSRGSTYAAVRNGSIPSLRIGSRWLVPKAALMRLLAQAEESNVGHDAKR